MEYKEIHMNRNNLFACSSQTFCGQLYSKNLPSSISDVTQTELEQLPNDFLSSEMISKFSENQLNSLTLLLSASTQGPGWAQYFLLPIMQIKDVIVSCGLWMESGSHGPYFGWNGWTVQSPTWLACSSNFIFSYCQADLFGIVQNLLS